MKVQRQVTLGTHRNEFPRPIDNLLAKDSKISEISKPKSIRQIEKMDKEAFQKEIKALEVVKHSKEQETQHKLFKEASEKDEVHFQYEFSKKTNLSDLKGVSGLKDFLINGNEICSPSTTEADRIPDLTFSNAPTQKSIGHFWSKVLLQKMSVIIMLCAMSGPSPCHKYFPTSKDETITQGGFEIKLKAEETDPELKNNFFVQRTFQVTDLNQKDAEGYEVSEYFRKSTLVVHYEVSILLS